MIFTAILRLNTPLAPLLSVRVYGGFGGVLAGIDVVVCGRLNTALPNAKMLAE